MMEHGPYTLKREEPRYCISTPCEIWVWLKGDMEPASESLKTNWAHTIPTIATL